jgi:hypothetical protein
MEEATIVALRLRYGRGLAHHQAFGKHDYARHGGEGDMSL